MTSYTKGVVLCGPTFLEDFCCYTSCLLRPQKILKFPVSSVGKECACNAGDSVSLPGLGRSSRERDRLPTPVFLGFPCCSDGKKSTCNVGDLGSIPGLWGSPGEGKGYPLQYSWASLVAQLVKNPPAMRETWVWSLGWEDPLEKGKATRFSILAGEFHGL